MTDSNCTRTGCESTGRYRAPDHASYRGRGDWADRAADMLLHGGAGIVDQCPECRTPPGGAHNAECPNYTGEDIWPLERAVAYTVPDSQTGNGADAVNPLHTHMRQTFDRCLALAVAKNAGYASDDDPLENFHDAERLGVATPIGIAIRMSDKWARLCRLLKTGENPLPSESITDTLDDLVNYAAILQYALSRNDTEGQ